MANVATMLTPDGDNDNDGIEGNDGDSDDENDGVEGNDGDTDDDNYGDEEETLQ